MLEISALVLPFFGMILVGYLTAKFNPQPEGAMGWLNSFIIYVALPALFFHLVAKTPFEELKRMDFVFASVLSTYITFALVFAIAVLITRAAIPEATIQGLTAAYGNIGYMGPGIALLAFGEKAAVPVALIVCFENVMHFTIAPALMAVAGSDKRKTSVLVFDIIKKVCLHPFIVATILGIFVAFLAVDIPKPVDLLIEYLARAAAPCALFAMGVSLAIRPVKRLSGALSYIVPAKLILLPIIMYVVLSIAGDFDPIWVYSAILLAGLPTAANVFVIANQYGVWVERASSGILVTTLISVFTLSLLLYLITSGILPPDLFPN